MKHRVVSFRGEMPVDKETLFAWHMQPAALQRMLPPWRKIKILSSGWSPASIGSTVEMSIRLGPFWRKWTSQHTDWKKGEYFIDQQIEGPFHFWRHVHRFLPNGDHSSFLEDEIEYAPPFSLLSFFPGKLQREIEKVFNWRHARLAGDLAAYERYPKKKMRILLSGASGLLGSNLTNFLRAGGHDVVRLVRKKTRAPDAIVWDPENGIVPREELEGFTAVIHLAGANIAEKRWTLARKKELFQSRSRDTWVLAHALARLQAPPSVFISASAVGYYGDQGTTLVTEESKAGKGFLADLCQHWERASEVLRERGIRVVHTRLGSVISPQGGALKVLLPLFRVGLGASLGKGDQWFSWIGVDDAVYAFYHVLMTPDLQGAVNLTSPICVTNKEFGAILAKACKRPYFFRIPAPLLNMVLGDMSRELLLTSIRAYPEKLLRSGFDFRTPELSSAILL